MNPLRRGTLTLLRGPLFLVAVGVAAGSLIARAVSDEGVGTRSRVAPYRFRLVSGSDEEAELRGYEERLKRNPASALDQALLARAYLQKARRGGPSGYEMAERQAQASLEKLPSCNIGAKLVLAKVAEARHDFVRSLQICEEVRREKPGGMEALSIMLPALLAQGKVPEATRLADTLLARFPSMGAFVAHGLVMASGGRDREAIYDFTRAIELEEEGDVEESSRARGLLGRLHLRHGRHDVARDLLLEALRIDPVNVPALGWLGDLEMKEKNFRAAATRYSEAFERSGEAHYLSKRAAAQEKVGDAATAGRLRGEAERLLRSSLTRDSFGHRRYLAECLLSRGEPADVREALELLEAELHVRRDAETLGDLGRGLLLSGRAREAQSVVREALRTGLEEAELHLAAARIERALGNERRAQFHLQSAREIDPTCNGERNP